MDPDRLTGFVYPVKKNGVPVRGRWQLWVNLPSEAAFDRDGQPVLDAKGRQKQKYPKTTKVVEAQGKKAAERLLETRPTASSRRRSGSGTATPRRPSGTTCASRRRRGRRRSPGSTM